MIWKWSKALTVKTLKPDLIGGTYQYQDGPACQDSVYSLDDQYSVTTPSHNISSSFPQKRAITWPAMANNLLPAPRSHLRDLRFRIHAPGKIQAMMSWQGIGDG